VGRCDHGPHGRQAAADREIFEKQLRTVLKYLSYAPVIFSPRSKDGPGTVKHEVKPSPKSAQARIDGADEPLSRTRRLSARFGAMSKRVRIFYMTRPPWRR